MSHENVWAALFAAKREFSRIVKDSKVDAGKAGRYKYAKLEDILEMVGPAFDAHDLLLMQPVGPDGVHTILVHVPSGTNFDMAIPLPASCWGDEAKRAGSWISYLRRYGLLSALGIVTEDDDGQRTSQPYQPPRRPEPVQHDPETGEVPEPPLELIDPEGLKPKARIDFVSAEGKMMVWAKDKRPEQVRSMMTTNAKQLQRLPRVWKLMQEISEGENPQQDDDPPF